MHKILSSLAPTYAKLDDILEINLEESPNINAEWNIELPPSFIVAKGIYTPYGSKLTRTWLIKSSALGQYTITCNYRKFCCGRRIIATETFTVIVDK